VTPRSKVLLAGAAALGLALPALAQESLLPPGFGNEAAPLPPPEQQPATNQASPSATPPATRPRPRPAPGAEGLVETIEGELAEGEELEPPPPPIEMPESARRDPRMVGALDPVSAGLGPEPWGRASGRFLSVLMRRQGTPLPSRWLHITLRNALLARSEAPPEVHPVDWAAERAWLLLRMGEADAARMIVQGVDVADFTPKMSQVAVQSSLASADPAGLCPLRESMARTDARVLPLTQAICAALEGEASSAASLIEQARRRGRIGGIDLVLADKVVGAGADTARAVTVEWEPVEQLTSWRFGLAAATGMAPPERLINAASPQLRAWQARAPMLSAEQRLPSARIAAGLGVLSSSALVDLYAQIYDATDPSDLPGTDPWYLRTAFGGRDQAARLDAMRRFWKAARSPVEQQASRTLLALAATRIIPDAKLQDDADKLIASMLAGGFDLQAGRWSAAVRQMDDKPADRAWALLALGTTASTVDVSFDRIDDFVSGDGSANKQRSRLLVAGLVGTGRIDVDTANRLNDRHGLGLGRMSAYTRLIDAAGRRGQAGTAALLAAVGMQTSSFARVPSAHLLHALGALRRSGMEYQARMIAAEALART
jgi:hypothetical protein